MAGGDYPKFTVFDAVCWKLLPTKWGCGDEYLWSFKYSWIRHNKDNIKEAAASNHIPALLLAGVALVEVGGKDFTDWPVFNIRSFDWSGPAWVDRHLTITKNPGYTSMGAVSIQLRRAAETMGLDSSRLTQQQLNTLAIALQSDRTNLFIVAKHLHQLVLIDNPQIINPMLLSDEQIRLAGTRYWYGPDASHKLIVEKAAAAGSYGSNIVRNKSVIENLLK